MIAVVTGASRGIGAELVHQLEARGDTVIATARRPEGDQVQLDVTDPGSVSAFAASVGAVDVLINNAAAFVDWTELGTRADLDEAERVMQTNLFGAWRVTKALLPKLQESAHPRVVMVSSGGGSHGDEAFGLTRRGGAAASYGISKAALNALTSTLAAELAGTPVLVNAACPGLTATWPGAESMGARPIADGASVLWAATLPDDGPRGGFFRDGERLPW